MNIQNIKNKLRGTDYINDEDLEYYIETLLEDHDQLEDMVIDMYNTIEYYKGVVG